MTCYDELGILLWDIVRIRGLTLVGQMYDMFSPIISSVWTRDSLNPYGSCFVPNLGTFNTLKLSPKFTEWVKEFVPE